MKKSSRTTTTTNVKDIASYHGAWFAENLAWNSDRPCPIMNDGVTYKNAQGKIVPLCHYGTEMEIECNTISSTKVLAEVIDKVILPNFGKVAKAFKVESDGSLGGRTSAEIISQPMSKGRIRNDYKAYMALFTYFDKLHIYADSTVTNCGMHVNVSNGVFGRTEAEQDEAIRKLYYVINRYFRFMCHLFKRPEDKTYWCDEMTSEHLADSESYTWCRNNDADDWDWRNAKSIEVRNDPPSSHHNCLNLSHINDGRIEIRLVGGQADYWAYRNTMESVFFLTETIGKRSWADLEDLTKIFSGCNQYVVKRLTECIGYDGFTSAMFNTIEHKAVHDDCDVAVR